MTRRLFFHASNLIPPDAQTRLITFLVNAQPLPTPAQAGGLFVSPALAAAGVAAVAIPIIIHLLFRVRRKPEAWAAMRFLLIAYKKQRRRLRLEQWLLLAVRCLAVALLGLAMAGPLLAGLFQTASTGRLVHLVIDDSMTSGVETARGQTRLDGFKTQAFSVLDGLGPEDRVVMWRASEPVKRLGAEPIPGGEAQQQLGGAAPDVARQWVQDLEPGFNVGAVPAALEGVAQELRDIAADPQRSAVVVLSDWSRAGGRYGQPPASTLESLGALARLVVTDAQPAATNLRITAVQPSRRVLLTGGAGDASVLLELEIARYGDRSTATQAVAEVALHDRDGRVVSQSRQPVSLPPGQAEVRLSVALPLPESAMTDVGRAGTDVNAERVGSDNQVLGVRTRLRALGPGGLDALRVDDDAFEVLSLRPRLGVLLVESVSARTPQTLLTPGQWVQAALAPGDDEAVFAVTPVSPESVTDDALQGEDAAVVLDPQRVALPGWQRLNRFARAGGVVWVFAPADLEADSTWATLLKQVFAIPGSLGTAVRVWPEDREGVGWSLDPSVPSPGALSALSASWRALLSPVQVQRYWPLDPGTAEVWLRLRAEAAETTEDDPSGNQASIGQGAPLLTAQPLGRGWLLISALPMDLSATNLPVKPLVVPLLQDAMRSLQGRGATATVARVGQRPALGGVWTGAGELRGLLTPEGWSGADSTNANQANAAAGDASSATTSGWLPMVQQTGETAVSTGEPLRLPGVFVADRDGRLALAVNPPPGAGDTDAPRDEQLTRWLDVVGPWEALDSAAPGALWAEAPQRSIGWALLWVAAALVLLETWLARRMSHASTREGASVAKQVLQHLRGRGPVESVGDGL